MIYGRVIGQLSNVFSHESINFLFQLGKVF